MRAEHNGLAVHHLNLSVTSSPCVAFLLAGKSRKWKNAVFPTDFSMIPDCLSGVMCHHCDVSFLGRILEETLSQTQSQLKPPHIHLSAPHTLTYTTPHTLHTPHHHCLSGVFSLFLTKATNYIPTLMK